MKTTKKSNKSKKSKGKKFNPVRFEKAKKQVFGLAAKEDAGKI